MRRRSLLHLVIAVLTVLIASAVAAAGNVAVSAPPTISVRGVALAEGDQGTADAAFTLRLSRARSRSVSVRFATADGSARAGADYVARRGVVAFKPGQTARQVRVGVVGDTVPEAEETFFLVLSRPRGARVKTGRATARIAPSDLPGRFTLRADMTGSEYVPPPGHPTGHGTLLLTLDPEREQVEYTISVSGMEVGESGICQGARGEAPTAVLRLDYPPQASGSKRLELATILKIFAAPENYCALARLDITAPGIRGQLTPAPG